MNYERAISIAIGCIMASYMENKDKRETIEELRKLEDKIEIVLSGEHENIAKYKPGQMVKVKRASFSNRKDFFAVICEEDDPNPCMMCQNDKCVEWANLLGLDGHFYYHIPECQMESVDNDTHSK